MLLLMFVGVHRRLRLANDDGCYNYEYKYRYLGVNHTVFSFELPVQVAYSVFYSSTSTKYYILQYRTVQGIQQYSEAFFRIKIVGITFFCGKNQFAEVVVNFSLKVS